MYGSGARQLRDDHLVNCDLSIMLHQYQGTNESHSQRVKILTSCLIIYIYSHSIFQVKGKTENGETVLIGACRGN